MVLSRTDKRKRKEGDLVDLMEPLSESSKRTKVHAQRKFAQGASTVFSPSHTPIKDKEKSKPPVITELITHKRPNTEDFLTFLCFRGTSILPPSLNFFNVGTKKEKVEPKQSSFTGPDKSPNSINAQSDNQKGENNQKTVTKVKSIVSDKKKVSNTIQKKITKFKSTTSTVQALKKKYQEQRLAKQRIKNKFKRSSVMRTRSCTERAILKVGGQLAPRKFLPRIENKRLGLRSSVFKEKTKKAPKCKPPISKTRRKVVKEECSESSESEMSTSSEEEEEEDVEEGEEELPLAKSSPHVKRTVQKQVQKKICTRSKTETRRITRSHTGTSSQENLSKRPTRKTKEAAAAYMEILGRRLVSPGVENDDNVSTGSFSELPNTRKNANADNDSKGKMKQTIKTVTRTRSCKTTSFNHGSNKQLDKSKNNKIMFKSKRLVKVQKYCEIESDEESESSMETDNTRPVTRRSVGKLNKPTVRHLRSASKNLIAKVEVQTTVNTKNKTQVQTSIKSTKGKFLLKRKRELASDKSTTSKNSEVKQKEGKDNANKESESDEETLGMLLSKLKRKKDIEVEEEKGNVAEDSSRKERQKLVCRERVMKLEVSKISDDEESFHGFTKKTITNVMTFSQPRNNSNTLSTDETNTKVDKSKTEDTADDLNMTKSQDKKNESSLSEPSHPVADSDKDKSIKSCKLVINTTAEIKHEAVSRMDEEKTDTPTMNTSTTNIADVALSALHIRKEKVNMSTEQIEKWLNESTFAKEESKLEMESVSNFKYDTCEKKTDTSHLSISTKIQHLVRPVNVTLSKLSEKPNVKDRTSIANKSMPVNVSDASTSHDKKEQCTSTKQNKPSGDAKDCTKGKTMKSSKDSSPADEDSLSKSDQNSLDGSVEKKLTNEKKSIFQPRKPFLPKVKERKTVVPNVNAFSPENESSVYAFESDTEVPINTPFRRKAREQNKIIAINNEVNVSGERISKRNLDKPEAKEKVPKIVIEKMESEVQECKSTSVGTSKFELPKSFGTLANIQVLPLDKLTTSWSNVNCSASIAVQVNLDESNQEQAQADGATGSQQKSTEISTQTENSNENDDENDGQLFYIPLQAVTRGGSNLVQGQQLIQGVAVKLGTDGPNGPNQKVLLRAKLVTKPPSSIARCPPIGTVQPTTRTPPTNTGITDQPAPSTSAVATTTTAMASTEPLTVSPTSSENIVARPAVSTTTVSIEKLTKSPKGSRERKMSVDSTKNTKRCASKSKLKNNEVRSPTNNVTFPSAKSPNGDARLVEAPTFHPTEKDFQDPLEYIDKIRPIAEKFGICRVVPPSNFKPECKVSDDMRFTAYNQYVHRMLHRWGPNVKEMMAIKTYLATQSITLSHPPWIGGMEVDLPHLYQTVQSLGGLKEVIEKKKWQKVADGMKIPKSAQDRVTKLDDIYCKYLLPYDTLSPDERDKLFKEVEAEWLKRESKVLQRQNGLLNDNYEDDDEDSSDEIEECIVKGRNMPLNAFYRIARNTQRMWFGENQRSGNETEGASADEVESAFWKHVAERKRHVCVHAASIDSSGRGFGFSVAKNSPFARHPWNLKVLTNNAGSVLRALGPIMGVTVPTLHVGMLFSACCWYRDPHGLPWIEYLHTGAKKIWYGIPDEHNNNFKNALSKMVPRYCKNKIIWLPSDTAMVPPDLLVSNGVSLCQTVQEPGQFIIVFPKAFTSSICTGYVVSESVYFAQPLWLETAEQVFKDIQDSCEPSIFSFERLLFNIINDSRSHIDVLKQILPSVTKIREKEIHYRKELNAIGLTNTERLPLPDSGKRKKGKKVKEDDGDFECETCRSNLFVSLINNSQDESVYCLPHGLQLLTKKKQNMKHCTLMYTYNEGELDELIRRLEDRIEAKSKKSNQIKQAK